MLTHIPRIAVNTTNGMFFYAAVSCIGYFWIFSAYHLSAFFVWTIRHQVPSSGIDSSNKSAVAVCWTVCNDFDEECILSVLNLDYGNYHVFVCDDSTDPAMRAKVEAFVDANRYRCSLIRRNDRSGFKAGNLNNALAVIGDSYQYILLADSDSIITRQFIRSALAHFRHDKLLAFVQASHRASTKPKMTRFSRALALGVECMWRFTVMKNNHGMPPMLGHGAMLRLSHLRKAGGFPNRVSEDLALTVRLRALGYYGLVAEDLVCEEAVPATFNQYRRRFEKCIVGSVEFLLKDWRMAFRQSAIPLFERIDLAFNILNMLNMVVLLGFLLLSTILWPAIIGTTDIATVEIPTFHAVFHFPAVYLQSMPIQPISIGMRVLVIGATLASLVYFMPDFLRRPFHTTAHVSNTFTCFCSVLVPVTLTMLLTLCTRRYEYRVTGDVVERRAWRPHPLSANFQTGKLGSLVIEVVAGFALCAIAFATLNLFLGAIAVGITIAPLLDVFGWESGILTPFRHLPFLLLCTQLFFVAVQLPALAPMTNGVVFIHF